MQTLRAANPFKSYRQIATQTAPPGQLVLMLFDGALKCLDCALAGFQLEDFAERNLAVHTNLQHANDIIRELNGSLDMQAGGELAATLRNLYNYFETRLNESNRKKSPAGVREILPMIKELRDAWNTMLSQETGSTSTTDGFPVPRFALS